MRLAVIGSRGANVEDLGKYLPPGVTEIVSGGARGIDRCAQAYAQENGIPCRVFLPDYRRYGRGAPLRRNRKILEYADAVLAFWDGTSRGTAYTVALARELGMQVLVVPVCGAGGSSK